jgi:hypothetical protein
MSAPPLNWKEDKGCDIHLIRGGPESRKLIDALDVWTAFRNEVGSGEGSAGLRFDHLEGDGQP